MLSQWLHSNSSYFNYQYAQSRKGVKLAISICQHENLLKCFEGEKVKRDIGCTFKKRPAYTDWFYLIFSVCGNFWPRPSMSVCLRNTPLIHTMHTAVLTWQDPLPSLLLALTLGWCCFHSYTLYTPLVWKSLHPVVLTHVWLMLFYWEREACSLLCPHMVNFNFSSFLYS